VIKKNVTVAADAANLDCNYDYDQNYNCEYQSLVLITQGEKSCIKLKFE